MQAELSDEHVSKHPSAACFASSTQADLTSSGFKLVGSAQVWKDESLLQQGSLPWMIAQPNSLNCYAIPMLAARAEALALYCQKTTPLHTFAPGASWDDVALAFKNGFSLALHETFVEGELSTSEWELARQLVEEKYSKLVWQKERITLQPSRVSDAHP